MRTAPKRATPAGSPCVLARWPLQLADRDARDGVQARIGPHERSAAGCVALVCRLDHRHEWCSADTDPWSTRANRGARRGRVRRKRPAGRARRTRADRRLRAVRDATGALRGFPGRSSVMKSPACWTFEQVDQHCLSEADRLHSSRVVDPDTGPRRLDPFRTYRGGPGETPPPGPYAQLRSDLKPARSSSVHSWGKDA